MINHKKLMYWLSKEDYIDILNHNITSFEKLIKKLIKDFEEAERRYDERLNKSFSFFINTPHGKIDARIDEIENTIKVIEQQINILTRTNVNNVNFIYDSDEMKQFTYFIENEGKNINLNVVEE